MGKVYNLVERHLNGCTIDNDMYLALLREASKLMGIAFFDAVGAVLGGGPACLLQVGCGGNKEAFDGGETLDVAERYISLNMRSPRGSDLETIYRIVNLGLVNKDTVQISNISIIVVVDGEGE